MAVASVKQSERGRGYVYVLLPKVSWERIKSVQVGVSNAVVLRRLSCQLFVRTLLTTEAPPRQTREIAFTENENNDLNESASRTCSTSGKAAVTIPIPWLPKCSRFLAAEVGCVFTQWKMALGRRSKYRWMVTC